MYLVNEYTEISAPSSNGRWKYEERKVLSTTTMIWRGIRDAMSNLQMQIHSSISLTPGCFW